jgi:lipopolysaccharide transport system ATP-binding protein
MSEMAIRVENLGKQYQIGHRQEAYGTLRDAIAAAALAPWRMMRQRGRTGKASQIWALQEASFAVRQGEVLGIIGRNGAGKSTLLKILARVTHPTSGWAEVRGRTGSLLEVGTGFHPELTGRENIYLNGAVLGMKKTEIRRKFDEIVAFAEIEPFLDTPVKRYSSGMYMRLAFAVAAHLEPEILIVDEVLAVGDAAFQKKCLGKMKMVAREGRTVIFVSHNMAAIGTLCSSAIVLGRGKIIYSGTPNHCISFYGEQNSQKQGATWTRSPGETPGSLTITQVSSLLTGEQPNLALALEVLLASKSNHKAAFLAVDIADVTGTVLMQALPEVEGFIEDNKPEHCLGVEIKLPPLIPGQYLVTIWVGSHYTETLDEVKEVVAFEVFESPTNGRSYPHSSQQGYIVPPSRMYFSGLSSK